MYCPSAVKYLSSWRASKKRKRNREEEEEGEVEGLPDNPDSGQTKQKGRKKSCKRSYRED